MEKDGIGFPEEVVSSRLGFLELLYGIIFQPAETLTRVSREKPLVYSGVIFFGVAFINLTVTLLMARPGLLAVPGNLPFSVEEWQRLWPLMTAAGIVFWLVFSLVRWYISAAILHLTAELFGGRGQALGLLAILGCVSLPGIFAAPIEVIFYILGLPSWGVALISFFFGLWTLVLILLGLRVAYGFSWARSFAVIFAPLGFLLAVIVVLIFTVVTFLLPLVQLIPGGQGLS